MLLRTRSTSVCVDRDPDWQACFLVGDVSVAVLEHVFHSEPRREGAQLAVRQVRRQAPYWIVSIALMALLVSDLGYLYQPLYSVYAERDPIDFGWWISYALIVAVLLHPRVGEIAVAQTCSRPSLSPRRIVLLSLVTIAAPLTIAARSAAGASLLFPVLLMEPWCCSVLSCCGSW